MPEIFLVIYILTGGIDVGPPPIRAESMEQCRAAAEKLLSGPRPDAEHVYIGCVEDRGPSTKS